MSLFCLSTSVRSFRRLVSAAALLSSLTVQQNAVAVATPPEIKITQPEARDVFNLTSRRFEEPFLPTATTSATEDAALRQAITLHEARSPEDDFTALNDYLDAYPHSGWRVAVLTNLGLSFYHDGYFSKAIDCWERAWKEGKGVEDSPSRHLVDRAFGELVRIHAKLGHADRLEALIKEAGNRPVSGPATEALTGAREGLWMMRHQWGEAYLCGPMALRTLLVIEGVQPEKLGFLEKYRSDPEGVTLAQVSGLADQAHLLHKIVFRKTGAPVPVPSLVHWKVNHFAAIVSQQGERIHIEDPTFGRDLWITRRALESEATGYFLVPTNQQTSRSWRVVSAAESGQVRGMGFTEFQQFGANSLGGPSAHGDCNSGNGGASAGMCSYDITLLTVGVRLKDTPVGYTPPKGPDAHVMLVYNQREDSQPASFGWFNVGPKWTLSTLSYIQDDPHYAYLGANVMRYVAGGGSVAYTPGNNINYDGLFRPETRDASVLVLTSLNPIIYERRLQDGGKEIYGQSNGAADYPRRVFLTRVVDRLGNASTYSYDSKMRLTSITDGTGRETTFAYDLSAEPLLVTKITDPFGRSALLAYDASSRLSKITDVLGLQSQFTYDASGLISALTTPYGTTNFAYGDDGTTRWVNATDPLGYTERVEFHHQAPGIAVNDPQNTVPVGLNLTNDSLFFRNTFYWDKHVYPIAAGNYNLARITHFHHWSVNTNETAESIESIKPPLESRIWFTYPGQDNYSPTYFSGTYDRPTAIARVLDDGSSQETKLTYNTQGNVTDLTDPAGRETQFVYSPDGVDVTEIKQKTAASQFSTVTAATYNRQHLPLEKINAGGQTTSYAYNNAGQLLTITDALGHTTKINYSSQGYLTSVVNANEKIQVSFIYDGYGRIASRTDSEGYTVSYEYDALDRLTQERYPDGTTRRYGYDRLDLASVTDRQGRTTSFHYDANRQLIEIVDPLQRRTKVGYYENGIRKNLTDPNGNITSWSIDLQSRITGEHYADGKGPTKTYEARTSRLKSVTDALGQIKQYSYTIDDRIAGISYISSSNPTPNVSWVYDLYFPRPVTMTDGSGTTAYSYQSLGTPGALLLAQVDGPYKNDSIAFKYDALGRPVTRAVGGNLETFSYDAIDRLTADSNALGTFNLAYLGQTGQLTSQTLQGGIVGTTWTYDTNENDRRLTAIMNIGAARSYQLKSTPEGDITQVRELASPGSAFPSQTWNYNFDDGSRLISGISSLGMSYSYEYDAADNLTSLGSLNGTTSLSYNSLNQVDGYSYDANGNLLDDGQRTYTWDAENRLLSVGLKAQAGKGTTFRYDGYGRRIAVLTNRTESRYLWCGQQLCQARSADDVVSRRYFAQGEWIPLSGTALYYERDQLGSVRDVVAAQTGTRVASYDYAPYGSGTQTSGRIGTDLRFAGLYLEPNSGLLLSERRGYEPSSGRWISRDPIDESRNAEMNLYSYADSNPTSRIDPIGLAPIAPVGPPRGPGSDGGGQNPPNKPPSLPEPQNAPEPPEHIKPPPDTYEPPRPTPPVIINPPPVPSSPGVSPPTIPVPPTIIFPLISIPIACQLLNELSQAMDIVAARFVPILPIPYPDIPQRPGTCTTPQCSL